MKLMIFNIGQRKYALEVSQVCEVIRLTEITPVSDVADFVDVTVSGTGKTATLKIIPGTTGLAQVYTKKMKE